MIEQIKTIGKWVILPLTLVIGAFFYLITKVGNLKTQVAQSKAEAQLAKTLNKLDEAKQYADAKEQEFNSAYSDYKRASDDSGSSGLPGNTK